MRIKKGFWSGFFFKNPILVRVIGISPVVAASLTLKCGLSISIIMAILFLSCSIFAAFWSYLIPDKFHTPVYILISSIMLIPSYFLCNAIYPGIISELGVFAPMLIINTLISQYSDSYSSSDNLKRTAFDTLGNIIGFGFVVITISAFREILSYGTIYDKEISFVEGNEAFTLPFAGFILLGLLAALIRCVREHINFEDAGGETVEQ